MASALLLNNKVVMAMMTIQYLLNDSTMLTTNNHIPPILKGTMRSTRTETLPNPIKMTINDLSSSLTIHTARTHSYNPDTRMIQ